LDLTIITQGNYKQQIAMLNSLGNDCVMSMCSLSDQCQNLCQVKVTFVRSRSSLSGQGHLTVSHLTKKVQP